MWDLTVSVPDHCLSLYFEWQPGTFFAPIGSKTATTELVIKYNLRKEKQNPTEQTFAPAEDRTHIHVTIKAGFYTARQYVEVYFIPRLSTTQYG